MTIRRAVVFDTSAHARTHAIGFDARLYFPQNKQSLTHNIFMLFVDIGIL